MARVRKADKKIETTSEAGVLARPSLELCRELIEMSSDWIWKLDKNLRCIYSNSKVADILGYTVDEIIGKRPFDLVDKEEAERIKTFLSLQKEKRPLLGFRISHRHKNNSYVVTETNANPIFNERGEFDGYIGVNRDVTVLENLEQSYKKALQQYEEFETIVNTTSSIVVLWKNEKGWPVEYVSNNVLRLGYSCDEFYAKNFQFVSLIHPDDRTRIANEISLHVQNNNRAYFEQEYRLRVADGSYRWYSNYTHIRKNEKGVITHFQGIISDINDKKVIEQQLVAVQNQQKAILDTIPELAWFKNSSGEYIAVNDAFIKTAGKSRAEILGKTDFDLWNKDLARTYKENDDYVIQMKKSFVFEEPLLNFLTQELYTVESSKTPVFDERGMVIGTSGIAHDITKRLKQEAELRFLSTAVNQINEGITVFDRSGTISYVNSAFASMHGYQPSEMIGRQCTEFHSAQNITDLFSSREDHMRKSSYCGETLHFHKDGSTFPCRMNMSVLRDEKGYTAGIIATVRDISDEKSAQDSILASEERFRMFANASIDMIHLLDQDGTIIYANPISEKLLGYPIELLNTMNVLDLLHPKDRVSHKSEVGQFLLGLGPVSSRELRMKKADGVYIYVELRGFKLSQFGKGSLIGAIIRDISERKENELILCESEKQLREQAHKLEKKNIALNELLSQIELEKRYIKDSVVANIDKLIFPLIKKMRLSGSLVDHKYLDMLESNLSDLTSSFGHRIADKSLLLTPREIEICNLIKNGVTNKQISEMLHISLETTETHRSNIRKKLDIANKSVNLSVYLQSI